MNATQAHYRDVMASLLDTLAVRVRRLVQTLVGQSAKVGRLCECGVVERHAREVTFPISYDEESGLYQIDLPDGGNITLWRCYFCGGRFPSEKPVVLPDCTWLQRRLEGVTSLEGVIERLGAPTKDEPRGMELREEGTTKYTRLLTYRNLKGGLSVRIFVTPEGIAMMPWSAM